MVEGSYDKRTSRWLELWGFTQNPFAEREASIEKDLHKYFLDHFHLLIKGSSSSPQTTLVFADRGHGKTAQRMMIQKSCQPFDRNSRILAVPYVHFTEVIEEAGSSEVSLGHHVRHILIAGMEQLMEMLFQQPRHFFDMPPEDRAILCWYLVRYGKDGARIWTPDPLLKRLRAWDAVDSKVSHLHIQEALNNRKIRHLLRPDFFDQPRGKMLTLLVETEPFCDLGEPALSIPLLKRFSDLVLASQCEALYILVDGIDELPETWDSPDQMASLIRPMTHNTEITEMPHVAFKFFLPAEVEAALDSVLQRGRLTAYRLAWNKTHMAQMLRARLKHFNERGYDSLSALTRAETKMSDEIDERLVEYAACSPRKLILRGWELFDQKIDSVDHLEDQDLFITERDLLAVLKQWDLKEYDTTTPPLRLVPEQNQVVIGHRVISLTAQQFEVLRLLYQAPGEIRSKDDVSSCAYGTVEGVSGQTIDSLIYRIRQKIERDPKHPQYLITERGQGYRLNHFA